MAAVTDPYAACLLPEQDQRLWVVGLSSVPVPPLTLASVLALQCAADPARLAYDAPPAEIIPGCLLQLSGTYQLSFPKTGQAAVPILGVALVVDNPPVLLVAADGYEQAQVLAVAGDVLLGELDVSVGKQPGA